MLLMYVTKYTCIIYGRKFPSFLKLISDALNLFGSAQNTAVYSRDIHLYLEQWGLNFSSIKFELSTAIIFLVSPLKLNGKNFQVEFEKHGFSHPYLTKWRPDFFLHCCQFLGCGLVQPPLHFMFVEFF